jgi:hypothetical protein
VKIKTQSFAASTAHKLKLDESAENSQRAGACMSRDVINDHCEFEIDLKRTIAPRGKLFFSSKGHTTMHHISTSAHESSADRPPIAV